MNNDIRQNEMEDYWVGFRFTSTKFKADYNRFKKGSHFRFYYSKVGKFQRFKKIVDKRTLQNIGLRVYAKDPQTLEHLRLYMNIKKSDKTIKNEKNLNRFYMDLKALLNPRITPIRSFLINKKYPICINHKTFEFEFVKTFYKITNDSAYNYKTIVDVGVLKKTNDVKKF